MFGKEILKNLTAYQQGKQISEVKKEFQLKNIVKLASNENPYGYSQNVNKLFSTMNLNLEIYPDGYATNIRQALADKLEVSKDELVFGNGSDEIITLICRAFLEPGYNTVMAHPTFTQYRHHSLIEGATVSEVPTVDGYHDLDTMLEKVDQKTNVIWICAPDNPSGTLISESKLKSFLNQVPTRTLVVLDEAYYEFVSEENKYDTNNLLNKYPNLIVLRTFSKAYGLAGLRIGYGIMNKEIAHKLNIVRGAFNTTRLAQEAAVIALEDEAFLNKVVSQNTKVKKDFVEFLKNNNFKVYDSETNFILVQVPGKGNDAALQLLKQGYIVRSGELLGYDDTIRITIGLEEDMENLKEVMLELKSQT